MKYLISQLRKEGNRHQHFSREEACLRRAF